MTEETHLSDREFKRLVEAVGDEVETRLDRLMINKFELIGVDISTPEARGKFRDNISWLSGYKIAAETMKRGAMKRIGDAIVGAFIAAFSAVAAFVFMNGKPPLH